MIFFCYFLHSQLPSGQVSRKQVQLKLVLKQLIDQFFKQFTIN